MNSRAGQRPVHVVGFAQLPHRRVDPGLDETELVQQVTAAALEDAGLTRGDVGFTCSGSNDYVMGRPFSFAMAIDGLGAWPPIRESHVEMDGAWALYEAWVRLQHGDVDVALVYAFGKASVGDMDAVSAVMLDPYFLAPLGLDPLSLGALQARCLIDRGLATERDFAGVVSASRRRARDNPWAPGSGDDDIELLLAAPQVAAPLRAHDLAVRTDGAAAIVLAVGGGGPRISGIAHTIDCHQPGSRDLTLSESTRRAAQAAGRPGRLDVAELHAPTSAQHLVLQRALDLHDADTFLDPSGGSLAADTPMVTGLVRIGEAADRIRHHGADRALAHATSGPCLQHNLVCLLERA